MPDKVEYNGQCLGGPDHGNIITSDVPIVDVVIQLKYYYRGTEDLPDIKSWRRGSYIFTDGAFIWVTKPRSMHDDNPLHPAHMSREAIIIDNLADMDD